MVAKKQEEQGAVQNVYPKVEDEQDQGNEALQGKIDVRSPFLLLQ